MRDCVGFSGRLTRVVLGVVIDRDIEGLYVRFCLYFFRDFCSYSLVGRYRSSYRVFVR